MLTVATPTAQELVAITRLGEQFRVLREELMKNFPERGWLIDQIIVSLVAGHDVLIYGSPGTGKSMLIKAVLANIVGKGLDGAEVKKFSSKITNETTADELLGPRNLPHYEQTGQWIRTVTGYFPDANFAYLDEVFDGPAVLRGMNDILNERELNEPPQLLKCPLYTTIGATNRSPEQITAMLPQLDLDAFNDRWFCLSKVEPLKDPANQDLMIANYLMGIKVTAPLNFADIQKVVRFIQDQNQFPSYSYLQAYREIVTEFRAKSNKFVSDRRLAQLTQIVEAQAIVQGRTALYYDDLEAIGLGLCDTKDSKNYELFKKVADNIIDVGKKANNEHVDVAERGLLNRIEIDLDELSGKARKADWPATTTDVGDALKMLTGLEQQLRAVEPQLAINESMRQQLISNASALRTIISTKI